MAIEDIPQVQLANAGYTFDTADLTRNFNGKFVVLQKQVRPYIFARKGFDPHREIVEMFYRVAENNYGVKDSRDIFQVAGGGLISIARGKIILEDESEQYGKYDLDAVSPIMKEWARKNFPEGICLFD